MDVLTISEAAARLGVTVQACYQAMGFGRLARVPVDGPIRVTAASVDAWAALRRDEALVRVVDPVAFAQQLHDAAWPVHQAPQLTADGRSVHDGKPYREPPPRTTAQAREALRRSAGYDTGVTIFGQSAMDSVTLSDGAGTCRWCLPRLAARVHGTPAPELTPMWRALFGTNPCRSDQAAWKAAENAEKVARRARLAEMQQRARVTANARVSAAQQALRTEQTRAAKLTAAPGGRVALTAGGQGAVRKDVRPEGLTAQELATKARNRRRLNWSAG